MRLTLSKPAAGFDPLSFRQGEFAYDVRKTPQGLMYTVTGKGGRMEAPLEWAFGTGTTGVTWLFRQDGRWHETRVSLYLQIKGLDLTVGAANQAPSTLAEAAGKALSASDAAECFGCHSTGAVRGNAIDFAALRPGVHCDNCHEGALDHARTRSAIRNPGKGTAEEISEFCGRCHRTWEQVQLMRIRGINTIRFQPYRLTNSKCYDADDKRISCIACHDPHAPKVAANPAAYDSRCLACHTQGKTCPTATSACTSCHMPKFELPGAHREFTDHQIRVIRAGQPFPN